MIPLYFEATNFCQHKKARVDYQLGITGVIGDNGNGKSNLIDAAQYFAWTGDVPQDSKEDFLKWGESKGHTVVTFQINGITYKLSRNIHNASCDLSWKDAAGNDCEVTGQKKVNAMMVDFLGMPFEVFRETCFCAQTSLIEIINMPPAKRMEYFQKICGVQRAEVLRGTIQTKINNLPVVQDMSSQLTELQLVLAKDLERKTQLESDLQLTRAKIPAEGCISRMTSIQLELTKQSAEEVSKKVQNIKVNLQSLQEQLQKLVADAPAPITSQILDTHRKLAALHREYSLVYQSYQTGVQELQSFDQSLPVPVTKPDDSTILAIKNMLIDKKPLYQMAKSKICPTCNREFSFTTPPDDVIKVYEDTAAALVPLETAYNADLRKFNDYERRLAIYTNQKETLERKVANLSTKLQTFTDDVKDFDIVAYDQSVNSVRELTAKLNEYHTKLNQIQKDIQNHQHMHDTLMSQCVITDAQRHVYKTELALLTELNNNCTTLDLQLAGLSATIKTNQENLLRLQDNQQRYQKIKGVRTQLEKAREILHRDALPRVVMSRILGSLNACLEFYLTKFNSGIVAKITDDFDILASVNGGPLTHARRLSGGQKVAVVVSFRFALSEVFARSIPLLVLDEPTAWLDTKRKESMVDVLKLAKAFVEKGVYVFIMTHDPVLEPAMSRIIEV